MNMAINMLDYDSLIHEKFSIKENNNENIENIMNNFLHAKYGEFLSVDRTSIEKLGEINAYVDAYIPESIKSFDGNSYLTILKHVFYLGMDINDDICITHGPSIEIAENKIKNALEIYYNKNSEKLLRAGFDCFAKIPEIKMSATPVIEILRVIDEKREVILSKNKKAELKRINYFIEFSGTGLFNFEEKYGKVVIRPTDIYDNIKKSYGIFPYLLRERPGYFYNVTSIKPYVRAAYSYYYFVALSGKLINMNVEEMIGKYIEIYSKKIDPVKFQNYLHELFDSGILIKNGNKISGSDSIFKAFINKE